MNVSRMAFHLSEVKTEILKARKVVIEYNTALKLAKALLEEAGYDPSAIVGMDGEDMVNAIWDHEEHLAEALQTFLNDFLLQASDIKHAVDDFGCVPTWRDLAVRNMCAAKEG